MSAPSKTRQRLKKAYAERGEAATFFRLQWEKAQAEVTRLQARVAELEAALTWLNVRGRLGYAAHDRIEAALSGSSGWLEKHDEEIREEVRAQTRSLIESKIEELRAEVRRAALESVIAFLEREAALYMASSKRCDAAGNTVGRDIDAGGAAAIKSLIAGVRALASPAEAVKP
jgi:hypothetical protein